MSYQRVWVQIDKVVARFSERFHSQNKYRGEAELLRSIAAVARTGAPLPKALDIASRRCNSKSAKAMQASISRVSLGESVHTALENYSKACNTHSAKLLTKIVLIQHRKGGDFVDPCHRLASIVHERYRLDSEARSATAQARMSARIVIATPFALFLFVVWKFPETVQKFISVSMLAAALPGLFLILSGALVASGIARKSARLTMSTSKVKEAGLLTKHISRFVGNGAVSLQSLKLISLALLVSTPALFLAKGMLSWLAIAIFLICAALWPLTQIKKEQANQEAIVASGIETLLEVSIALFAAGATAHEVAVEAPNACPKALKEALAPAVYLVGLGMSIASAFRDIKVVQTSPLLDGWLHAVCNASELGSKSIPVLEELLRDARSQRREYIRSAAQTAAPRMQLALVLLVVPGVMWLMLLASVGSLLDQLKNAGVM